MVRIHQEAGPLIISIFKMLNQAMIFLCIFCLFGVSFSVAFLVISYGIPEGEEQSDIPNSLIGLWAIFGQFDLAFLPKQRPILGTALLIVYLFIMQILLINLLISIFGDAFGKINENSDLEYKYARLEIIQEWKERLNIPPPFGLFYMVISSVNKGYFKNEIKIETPRTLKSSSETQQPKTESLLEEGKREWKKKLMNNLNLMKKKKRKNKEEEIVKEILKNGRILQSRVDEIADKFDNFNEKRKKEKRKLKEEQKKRIDAQSNPSIVTSGTYP